MSAPTPKEVWEGLDSHGCRMCLKSVVFDRGWYVVADGKSVVHDRCYPTWLEFVEAIEQSVREADEGKGTTMTLDEFRVYLTRITSGERGETVECGHSVAIWKDKGREVEWTCPDCGRVWLVEKQAIPI